MSAPQEEWRADAVRVDWGDASVDSPVGFSGDELARERWLPIAGFPLYEVSDLGRLRSLRGPTPRILKLCWKGNTKWSRRLGTTISNGERKVNALVHRMVMLAFVGPKPDGMEIRHYPDRDVRNNRLTNLSWSTHVVNIHDKFEHGTIARGERHGCAKLSDAVASEIVRSNEPTSVLAKKYGVHAKTVQRIRSGRRRGGQSPSLARHSAASSSSEAP